MGGSKKQPRSTQQRRGRGGGGSRRMRAHLFDESMSSSMSSEMWSEAGTTAPPPPVEKDGSRRGVSTRVVLWEFGQNDAKRDSGSKLVRLGLAESRRVGRASFGGIVLSSEAKVVLSKADGPLVAAQGIGAINCSWNRLDEIPFGNMGAPRNHRVLPFLVAANSVNYGRPFKMNTAEAIAAALVIAGFPTDADAVLEPFPYGPEFLRLNADALRSYADAHDAPGVRRAESSFLQSAKAASQARSRASDNASGYLDAADLPPSSDDDLDDLDDLTVQAPELPADDVPADDVPADDVPTTSSGNPNCGDNDYADTTSALVGAGT